MTLPQFPQFFARLAPAIALFALTSYLPAQTSSTSRPATTTAARPASNASRSSSGSGQYPSNTMLGNALIQIDPETRSLIVVTDEDTQASVAKIITNLDHPKPQVLIKCVIVEVSLNKDLDVGLEGGYTFKTGNSGTAVAKTLLGMANALASGSNGAYGTFNSGNSNWEATLHMLSSSGKAKVLSRPSIMARNNQQAVIVVGQTIPLITASQVATDGAVSNSIKYQDVGIILRVTPFITSDKTVEMIVAPEISSYTPGNDIKISANFSAPVIDKRSAETVVVTPNATTVVIGGLMQKKATSNVTKIPILGDIPILGYAFRHTVKTDINSELLIFLTPYIVESTQRIKDVTLTEANRADLTRDSLTPEEASNNLDTLRLMPQVDYKGQPQDKTEFVDAPAPLPTSGLTPAKNNPKK